MIGLSRLTQGLNGLRLDHCPRGLLLLEVSSPNTCHRIFLNLGSLMPTPREKELSGDVSVSVRIVGVQLLSHRMPQAGKGVTSSPGYVPFGG